MIANNSLFPNFLKVLKRYHALWGMNRVKSRRPNLYIVNLQVSGSHLQLLYSYNQLNLSTTATLRTEESGHFGEVAVSGASTVVVYE